MSMNDPDWGRQSGNKSDGNDESNSPQNQGPRNGRGNQDGPPDLDELWRDFNNNITQMFNKKGRGPGGPRGGGSGFDGPNMPNIGKSAGLLAVAGVALWLASGFFIIEEGTAGVVTQFGTYHHTAPPGFQWRMPYPIQNHETVNVSAVRIVEVGYRNSVKSKVLRESLMLTEDENIIDIQFAVQYRLSDAKDYLYNVRNPDEAVKQASETAIREVVGKSDMDFVLQEGREEVAIRTREVVQSILDSYGVGIVVNGVTVQNVQPPQQVQAAFDDVVKANQDKERNISEGRAYANDVVPRARGRASRLLEEASGYKERVVAQAAGEAARFSAVRQEYTRAPEVTRERLYIETMQQFYSNVPKVMVNSEQNNQLLYLPLDKMMSQSGNRSRLLSSDEAAKAERGRDDSVTNSLGSPMPQRRDSDRELQDSLRSRDRGGR